MGNYSFAQVPLADIPRSTFNRSHGHKTTFDSGYLIPIYVDEALPGDTFNVHASLFARLATPIAPIMDNMHMDVFFFAVPNRLLWNNWQKFMGEQDNPGDSTDYQVPEVVVVADGVNGSAPQSLEDYFGWPIGITGVRGCAFWHRAYNLIWNEWFRDQNLQDSVLVPKDDGPDYDTEYHLLKRGKRHDYFTSCLPWPQKDAGVELPLGTSAPVIAVGDKAPTFTYNGGNAVTGGMYKSSSGDALNYATNTSATLGIRWNDPKLSVDLSSATAATINSLRQAFQIQKLLERDARGGTRYVELLKSHFGVVSPDYRLQRPEYLGGGSIPVNINPVTQTSGTGTYTDTPQGNLAAYGVAAGTGMGFTKSFVEHSVILGMVMVRADLSYQQGMPRMFSRLTRYDFYWPAFSHLGEQAVLNKEIYYQPNSVLGPSGGPINDEAFGYQERWAEYRYFPSKITGKFRSGIAGGSLDFWHLAQEFTALPTLSASFIEENPPIDRVIAVQDEPQFIFDSHFKISCTRPMPTYSVPGLIDHF